MGVHLPVGKHVAETPDEVSMIPIPACQLALSMVTEGVMWVGEIYLSLDSRALSRQKGQEGSRKKNHSIREFFAFTCKPSLSLAGRKLALYSAGDRNICRASGGPQGGNVSWSAGRGWVGVEKMTSRPGASLVSLSAELCRANFSELDYSTSGQ